jgi:predicted RecA/RadA family phage recombinase
MMATQFVQEGSLIDYTPSSAVAAGDVVVATDRVFVAPLAIAANKLGSLATTGVWKLPKTTGTAWTFGQKLYWNDSGDLATTSASGNKVLGYAAAAAASGDAEGLVLLGQ